MKIRFAGRLAMTIAAIGWLMPGRAGAGNMDPTNTPGPTMHSLEDIYSLLSDVQGKVLVFPASVAKTGQTNTYATGDDGYAQKGIAWPIRRFSVMSGTATNCVMDNLTGLIWLKSPDTNILLWTDALTYCNDLDGSDGRGEYTDWRLPNRNELQSLLDASRMDPVLPVDHPFDNIQTGAYWSSTTVASDSGLAWYIHLGVGIVNGASKTITSTTYTWPVRGPYVEP